MKIEQGKNLPDGVRNTNLVVPEGSSSELKQGDNQGRETLSLIEYNAELAKSVLPLLGQMEQQVQVTLGAAHENAEVASHEKGLQALQAEISSLKSELEAGKQSETKVSAKGLMEAATSLKDLLPTVFELAMSVAKFVSGF